MFIVKLDNQFNFVEIMHPKVHFHALFSGLRNNFRIVTLMAIPAISIAGKIIIGNNGNWDGGYVHRLFLPWSNVIVHELSSPLSWLVNIILMYIISYSLVHITSLFVNVYGFMLYLIMEKSSPLLVVFDHLIFNRGIFISLAAINCVYAHFDRVSMSFKPFLVNRAMACVLFTCLVWKLLLISRMTILMKKIRNRKNIRHYNNVIAFTVLYFLSMFLWVSPMLHGYNVLIGVVNPKVDDEVTTELMLAIVICIPTLIHLTMLMNEPFKVYYYF